MKLIGDSIFGGMLTAILFCILYFLVKLVWFEPSESDALVIFLTSLIMSRFAILELRLEDKIG